jgi:two-component system sensor histidine kinase SenX3
VAVARDRTAERQVERVRRDFVANASHELKTPVASIQALAETLLHSAAGDPAARERFLEHLEGEAVRLSRLVGDLLDLSRLEGGLGESASVDLARVLNEECDRLRPRAEGAGLRLAVDAPEPMRVRGSKSDLGLMIHNLLDNAIRYSPDGGEVRAALSDRSGQVELRVTDTGLGIPARDLDRIFERFYRVDPARSRGTGGTGLGLAIVRHVVQSHGGDVEVRSVLGAGSTFIVRLPRADTA